ncbi:larval cuticle protein LCP-17-like [Chrysoperla carnea]|uniref:larval cuticle protein LCP-17-like n=1 Tax=Chrysoperla carnea TaxID=189513 RepID=UPI001D07244E|nr:larval cuticle protein LCP-17-like [Chrysoperla carnea]
MKFVIVSLAILSVAFAASVSEQDVPIVREAFQIEGGNFKYGYESGNGIVQKTKGTLKNAGTEQEAQEIQGSISYTSPEGVPVNLAYVANENGYQPSGDVLPVPPQIPELILRALEWARTHPAPESK